MNKEEFVKTHCLNCGTQRCEGIDSEWFSGCKKKWDLDGMNPSEEIERLNAKILKLAFETVKIREKTIIDTKVDIIERMYNEIFDSTYAEDQSYGAWCLLKRLEKEVGIEDDNSKM